MVESLRKFLPDLRNGCQHGSQLGSRSGSMHWSMSDSIRNRCPRFNGALSSAAERLAAPTRPALASVGTEQRLALPAFRFVRLQTTCPTRSQVLEQHWQRQEAKPPRPAFPA
jgi:hypothetical protein